MSSIPLEFRLPNTAIFRGAETCCDREEALASFAGHLGSDRLVLVAGDKGTGKTELVLQALHGFFGDKVDRTLYLELEGGARLEQLLVRLLKGLARALRVDFLTWSSLLADLDSAIATALDAADEQEFWVVLDGIDWTMWEDFLPLMRTIHRFARRSRWILVGTGFPDLQIYPGLQAKVFEVPGLDIKEMHDFAGRLRPELSPEVLATLIAESQGSPGRLLELLDQSTMQSYFVRARPTQVAWLDLLCLAREPLPESVLASVASIEGPLFDDEAWVQVEEWKCVQRASAGWCLASGVREAWETFRGLDALNARYQEGLVHLEQSDYPAILVERLRFLLKIEAIDDARSLMEAHGATVIKAGFAPELWELLNAKPTGDLEKWRLLVGAHCGSREALMAIVEHADTMLSYVPNDDLQTLHSRLTVLYQCSRFQAVVDFAQACLDRYNDHCLNDHDQDAFFRIGYARSSALLCLGRFDEALKQALSLEARTTFQRCVVELRRAEILASMDETEASLAICRSVHAHYKTLEHVDIQAIGYGLARTLALLRDFHFAGQVIDEMLATIGPAVFVLCSGRRALILQGLIALETGAFDVCQSMVERLAVHTASNDFDRLLVDLMRSTLRIETGAFEGLPEELERLYAQAIGMGLGDCAHDARGLRILVDTLQGVRSDRRGDEIDVPCHYAGYPALSRARLFHQEVRWGLHLGTAHLTEQGGASTPGPETGLTETGLARVPAMIARSQQMALSGDLDAALRLSAKAIGSAEAAAHQRDLLFALHGHCENLTMAGSVELREEARRLEVIARALPSPHWLAMARFFEAMGASSPDLACYALFESLAGIPHIAPAAARWSAFLLGEGPALDEVDEKVLASFQTRTSWVRPHLLSPPLSSTDKGLTNRTPWGIHRPSASVWFNDGSYLCLEDQKILWILLACLATKGGYATKEELLIEVWQVDEYHPLRHDNRLRLAVSKLRRLLQRGTRYDEFITSQDEGYALEGRVRLV